MVMARRPDRLVTSRSEADGFLRTRFHGQPRKGTPSVLTQDTMDVRIAKRSLDRALEYLERAAQEGRPSFERDELHRTALGLLGNAGRAVDEVVLRPHHALRRRGPT